MSSTEKYQHGKIYKLYSRDVNQNESEEMGVYIGSTIKTLERRLTLHKADCKRYLRTNKLWKSSCQIISRGGYAIKLLEEYPCTSKLELLMREQHWMDKEKCVNKIRAYLSPENRVKQRRKNRSRIIKCTCGLSIKMSNRPQHLKTKKHMNTLNDNKTGPK